MKKLLCILTFLMVSQLHSQEYCNYLPYSVNDVYGLVNANQEQTVNPKYKKLEIIGAYEYALFDNKYCYNLNDGKNVELTLNDNTSLVIIEKGLYVFNSKNNSMINPFTKEKITLKLKYTFFYNRTLYDKISNKNFEIIIAKTLDEKNMIFSNSKALNKLISGKFEFKDFQFIDFFENGISKEIGIMIKTNNIITCYNFDGTKSYKISEIDIKDTNDYSINFKDDVTNKFENLFGFSSNEFPKSFNLSDIGMAASGKFFNRFITKIELGNGYFLESNDYHYRLKSNQSSKLNNVTYEGIFIYDFDESFNYLEFTNSQSKEKIQFFVNHPNINPKTLMLPKEKLIEFELLK